MVNVFVCFVCCYRVVAVDMRGYGICLCLFFCCRVVAVDMRGYGDSDKPSGKAAYTLTKLTGDVKELIQALGKSYLRCQGKLD